METLIYIFLVFDLIFITWHLATRKFINPYTMDLYIGNKGCGKSSTMAKMIKKDIKNNIIVYANVNDIKINDVRQYDTFDLGHKKVENATIYVDEVSLFFDNRNYKNTSKEFISWLREVRHNRLRVNLFTQSYDCDIRKKDQNNVRQYIYRTTIFQSINNLEKITKKCSNQGRGYDRRKSDRR